MIINNIFGRYSFHYFKGHRGEAIAAIGSQWQWKKFAWGIEINTALPVLANFSEEGLDNPTAEDRFIEDKARFASHPQHHIYIYIGLSTDYYSSSEGKRNYSR